MRYSKSLKCEQRQQCAYRVSMAVTIRQLEIMGAWLVSTFKREISDAITFTVSFDSLHLWPHNLLIRRVGYGFLTVRLYGTRTRLLSIIQNSRTRCTGDKYDNLHLANDIGPFSGYVLIKPRVNGTIELGDYSKLVILTDTLIITSERTHTEILEVCSFEGSFDSV